MSFISNNTEYGILTDNEISSIIGNFSSDMIYDIVEIRHMNRFRPYQLYVGNLVGAINQNFKIQCQAIPIHSEELMQSHRMVLETIMNKICSLNNISINESNLENVDLYSLVYFLYDFFISRYTLNIINFFSNFIIREQNSIIESINIAEAKKSGIKDLGSNYSKKMFKENNNLAIIHANLDKVVENICGMDIDMNAFVSLATCDANITNLLCSCTDEIISIFQTQFVPCVKDPICGPVILTMIRLRLQELSAELVTAVI